MNNKTLILAVLVGMLVPYGVVTPAKNDVVDAPITNQQNVDEKEATADVTVEKPQALTRWQKFWNIPGVYEVAMITGSIGGLVASIIGAIKLGKCIQWYEEKWARYDYDKHEYNLIDQPQANLATTQEAVDYAQGKSIDRFGISSFVQALFWEIRSLKRSLRILGSDTHMRAEIVAKIVERERLISLLKSSDDYKQEQQTILDEQNEDQTFNRDLQIKYAENPHPTNQPGITIVNDSRL